MAVDVGVGLDKRLALSYAQSSALVRQADDQGYASAWTPSGVTWQDAFHICVQWAAASGPGLTTGISVVPAPLWTVTSLASQAATVGEITNGRFILGIGTGGVYGEAIRRRYDLQTTPPVAQMRDYLTILRGLLSGENVDYTGKTVSLHGVQLEHRAGRQAPRVPLYLAALGPQMVRLAGELADGVMPNWSTPEQIAWCRERIAEGAQRVGRDPSEVKVAHYIRVCVDDDEDAARRAFASQVLEYGLARPGASKADGYRGHFGRMGFEEVFTRLEERRAAGARVRDLLDDVPADLLLKVGYFGKPAGAPAALRALAQGLDTAIVRIITTAPGEDKVAQAIEACRPALWATNA